MISTSLFDTSGFISYDKVAVVLISILVFDRLTFKVIGVGIICTSISFFSVFSSLSVADTLILYVPCFVRSLLLVILAFLESIEPSV